MNIRDMKLTVKLLNDLDACQDAIDFVTRNNLTEFPLKLLNDIEGDYLEYVRWIKNIQHIRYLKKRLNGEEDHCILIHKKDDVFVKKTYNEQNRLLEYEVFRKDFIFDKHTHEYDAYGNMIKKNFRDGAACYYEYDSFGNMTKQTYADGHSVSYVYDAYGNKIFEETSDGKWTKRHYDSFGNVIHQVYSNAISWTMEYDAYGNMTFKKSDTGYWEKRVYDEYGNMTFYSDSNGCWYKTVYDRHGNIIRFICKEYDESYSFVFDDNGHLIQACDMYIPSWRN